MASYTYKEIRDALLAAGFEERKNNGGSHQTFVHPKTGFCQPIPAHSNGIVASGTAESILQYAIMSAYITKTNIASDKYRLSQKVVDFIKKQHAKMKENMMFLIPEAVRKEKGINSAQDAVQFINKKAKDAHKEYLQKQGGREL